MEFLQQNWYWAALAAVSGGLLVVDLLRNRSGGDMLSPLDATLKINREDALVVDVRTQDEFMGGHIVGARHIPLAELEKRAPELEKLQPRPVILCCQSGSRSANAVAILRKAGIGQVFNLRGGVMEWERAGQPLARGRK